MLLNGPRGSGSGGSSGGSGGGSNGVNAYAYTLAEWQMPEVGADVSVHVDNVVPFVSGCPVLIIGAGYMVSQGADPENATHLVFRNSGTTGNANPYDTVNPFMLVVVAAPGPEGAQGPTGPEGTIADMMVGGDLFGTLPNPRVDLLSGDNSRILSANYVSRLDYIDITGTGFRQPQEFTTRRADPFASDYDGSLAVYTILPNSLAEIVFEVMAQSEDGADVCSARYRGTVQKDGSANAVILTPGAAFVEEQRIATAGASAWAFTVALFVGSTNYVQLSVDLGGDGSTNIVVSIVLRATQLGT